MSETELGDNQGGVLFRQPVVDFSHLTSPDDLASIKRIERVGAVIVPESLAAAYAAIPAARVGSTIYVPDGAKVRVHTGMLTVGGDGLGSADTVLVVIGMLLITSPVTGTLPQRISVVGSVLAPRGSESALGSIMAGGTGSVAYYRYAEGQDIKVLSGQVKVSAATLANSAGGADDVLIAAGQVVVSGPVTAVGYAQIIVAGQMVAPESSRDLIEQKAQVFGQSAWYRGEKPWVVADDATVGPDFFRLLDNPISLVVLGDLTIADGVTEAAVHEKVTDVVLLGDIVAPADVVPVLQVLATESFGDIRIADGPEH